VRWLSVTWLLVDSAAAGEADRRELLDFTFEDVFKNPAFPKH